MQEMHRYELLRWGAKFDETDSQLPARDVLEQFRNKYGEAVIDVCGIRLSCDGVVL